jgi:hypothetical protein
MKVYLFFINCLLVAPTVKSYQSSLFYQGNCTQKISNSFQLIGSPMSIADALPGGLIFGTVQSAWTNLELGQYRLHVIDRVSTAIVAKRWKTLSGSDLKFPNIMDTLG